MLSGSSQKLLPAIGVVAPVFNEADGIISVVQEWSRSLAEHHDHYEIVLCDDASTDGTVAALNSMSENKALRLVRHDSNIGAGAALRTAIRASTADWIVLIDSDGQFRLQDGLEMWESIKNFANTAAIGVRRKSDRLSLVIGSRLTSRLANAIYGTNLRDFNCALKVVPGDVARNVILRANRFNYSTEMTSRLILSGIELRQFPVSHIERSTGHSSARLFRDGLDRLRFLNYLRAEETLLRSGAIRL